MTAPVMSKGEILIRAREAAIAEVFSKWDPESLKAVRDGGDDDNSYIRVVARALRDLSKPLSEIQPVDPDLVEAREIAGKRNLALLPVYYDGQYDHTTEVRIALEAIKRGRELAQASKS